MNKEQIFKAYYLTCSLLEEFTGICSMLGEEKLLSDMLDYVSGTLPEKELMRDVQFTFGLGKKNLKRALRSYNKYIKENE